MFENSGERIKLFAKIITGLNIAACVIWPLTVFGTGVKEIVTIAAWLLILGPFVSYFWGLLLHGFGDFISLNAEIEFQLSSIQYLMKRSSNEQTTNNNLDSDVSIIK